METRNGFSRFIFEEVALAKEKIRIVYLMRRAVGGMLTHVLDLADSLPKERYEVVIIAPSSERIRERLPALRASYIETDVSDNLNPIADLKSALKYRSIFKKFKPHILHTHGNKAALVGRMAALGLPIPVRLVTVHNILRYLSKPGLKQALAARLERWLSGRTDLIISVSKDLSNDLVNREKLPSSKVRVVYNGIDWRKLEVDPEEQKKVRANLGFSSNGQVVGMIARLASQKSPEVFIEAAKKLDNFSGVKFLLVGDGPLAHEVTSQIEKLGLKERFVLTGFRTDIPQLLSAIDIFVLSSQWEGVPYVLEEAMAAARPIVATAVGGVPELITSGQNGLLVSPGDSVALSKAIASLLTNPTLKDKLANDARETIRNKFSIEKMVEETVNIYEEFLAKKTQFEMA